MTRFEGTFLALVATQAAHSLEEYHGRLWEVFPPAAFLTSLVSADHRFGFIVINIALGAFGLWCFFWPVRHRWSAAGFFIGIWIVIETINGIGHPLWTLRERGYTPGVATAPLLLALAVSLAWQLKKARCHQVSST
jgi:hypothetical protein